VPRSSRPRRRARHAAARRGVPGRGALRRVWTGTAVLAAAVGLGLAATGGSYALWSSAAPARTTGAVTTGTATLAVTQQAALTSTGLLPGTSAAGSFSLANRGAVPLAATITTDGARAMYDGPVAGASLDELQLRVAAQPAGGTCASALSGAAASRLVGFRAADVLPRLEPGASATICVEVLLDSDAPQSVQGAVDSWSVHVVGTQVAS
jgi:DMSO/TMAO reductase YedYZ molybdopterin-dependent catalytic subunit